ncbi:hypothetical protein MXF40_18515 [Serratia marcescens]|uniref:MrpH family fimbial adhesin n=1 Tax=Serratia marcescens TaxID=615 RepID=UPI002DC02FA2|nr:hypothetical protein [Serratia marcescens]MEB6083374.1 hypothetical protein [Serratia marcescens]
MIRYKSGFKNKLLWMKRTFFTSFLLVFFICKASASMVWETVKAPIIDGQIHSANSSGAGSTGRLVSVDFNDQTPSPCFNPTNTVGCIITVGVFTNLGTLSAPYYYVGTNGSPSISSGLHPALKKARTMGELYSYLRQVGTPMVEVGFSPFGYPRPGWYCDPGISPLANCVIKTRWEAYSKVCYALVYAHSSTSYYASLPGQNCIGPTPPNNECNIDAGAVTLEHGQLSTDEVNGHKKKESVRLSCTYPANANISVVSNNASEKIELKADGSLFSTVTIDGVPGITGKKVNIPTGGVIIDLESTLHTAGNVEEGPFSGNAILIINSY